jgi:hypothetical protein
MHQKLDIWKETVQASHIDNIPFYRILEVRAARSPLDRRMRMLTKRIKGLEIHWVWPGGFKSTLFDEEELIPDILLSMLNEIELILNDLEASANLLVSYRVALEEDRPVQWEKRESDIRLLEAVGTFIGNILGPIMSAAVSSLTA